MTPLTPGSTITLNGWVHVRRDHGKLIFFDLRAPEGIIQVVVTPKAGEAYPIAESLRPEWCIAVTGELKERPEAMRNPEIATGNIELSASAITVHNESLTPPFGIDESGIDVNEELRLKYRYLDIRRARIARTMHMRDRIYTLVRDTLHNEGFTEVETPILTKSTPEGARDYLVPFRKEAGKFYALPQSPQQYKQLLMVGGINKYFQLARCMRDEDTRGDRQPEFTQLDMELAFTSEEEVMRINESLLIRLVHELYPEKRIQTVPFPHITYKDAIEKYGSDRPDIREDKNDPNLLAFCWVVNFPFFEKDKAGAWTFTHNPFSAPKAEHMELLNDDARIGDITAAQYDIVLNGWEIGGGSMRNHKPELLLRVLEILGIDAEKARTNFGHMLEAFTYGAPPHGGIAWGMDRLLMILQNEPNIREVIAFPKTGEGEDPMMQSPSDVTDSQLAELGLKLREKA